MSGPFVPHTTVWAGSSADVNVLGVSSPFLPGDVEWVIHSQGAISISGVSGSITTGIEGQWEGMFFNEMMWGSEDVVEWLLVPA